MGEFLPTPLGGLKGHYWKKKYVEWMKNPQWTPRGILRPSDANIIEMLMLMYDINFITLPLNSKNLNGKDYEASCISKPW